MQLLSPISENFYVMNLARQITIFDLKLCRSITQILEAIGGDVLIVSVLPTKLRNGLNEMRP